eukprot:g15688.t1
MTDVDEVVGTETEEDSQAQMSYVEPSNRFAKIKETYKGVTTALDLSEDTAAYEDFQSLLTGQKVSFARGEIVEGTVIQFEPNGALIDIGAKATAYMPAREASLTEVESMEELLELDEKMQVMIISDENEMGQVNVSIRRIQYEKAWSKVEEMQAEDVVFEGPIVAVNRGGAIVLVEGLRGFLPGSHMCGGLPTEEAVGKVMKFKFLEVNAENSKLVVSNRRAVLEQEMKELSRGDVVEGHVKAIKPYGVFVEIRGMSGLLHISQISFDRIEDLPSIMQLGMKLKCMIIDHDKVNGRIALSTKTLEPEPGDMIKNPQKVYDMAEATAAKYHQRMEHERKAREDAAKSIVMGLGDGLDSFDSDVLAGIADGIESRQSLPIYRHRNSLLFAVQKYRATVLVGETGCGKTTQIPQYLYEAGWTAGNRAVVCTQPRRVAAYTVANRVAEEMGSRLGETVGYAVRFDSRVGPQTKVKFCTDGMLLREMMIDPLLTAYSVVMLDEAHERTIYNDILFGLLKKIMRKREELRIIVASATLDAEQFRDFFETNRSKNATANTATILSIQGRQHPVDVLYTEKPVSNYVRAAVDAALAVHSSEPVGDILIFLPGAEEIDAAVEMLREHAPQPTSSRGFGNSTARGDGEGGPLQALPFYSALPINMQMKVFEPTRQGVRRVVVATTIAETSVTIDGIRYVIDPGFVRLPFYDPAQGFGALLTTLTSKASARQRAGRAGRVSPGKCLRLMTEEDYHSQLPAQTIPEMQRSDLSWVVLLLKALGIDDILHFEFLSPPAAETMIRALELLYALGALDDSCRLTEPLGMIMAEFPVEPCLAKFLASAWDFECVEDALTVAAMLSVQNPFVHPRGGSRERRERVREAMEEFAVTEGDHITYLNVFNSFEETGSDSEWCKDNCLSYRALVRAGEIRQQLSRYCNKFAPAGRQLSSCGDDVNALRRCLVAGFFANVAKLSPDGRYRTVRDSTVVAIHPSSVLAHFGSPPEWILFNEISKTSQLFVRDVTVIDPRWLTELAPHFYEFRGAGGTRGAPRLGRKRLGPDRPTPQSLEDSNF